MDGLSGISAGASVDIKRTDGEYLGYVAHMWKSACISLFLPFCVGAGVAHRQKYMYA
jgi:hypothetical protein